MSEGDPQPTKADSQPTSPEVQARKNPLGNMMWPLVFLVGAGAVVGVLLVLPGGPEATEKAAASRLIKQAFQTEETENKEEQDRKVHENGGRMSQLNGSKRTDYFAAFQLISQNGIDHVSPEVVATMKRYAPDFVASRFAVIHMREKGYDALSAAERAAMIQFVDVATDLRREAKESALRDPLWQELQTLLSLPGEAAEPFGLLTSEDRKQAVAYARQAKEQGFSSLTVDDVRLLIRAGADGYLKKLGGI